MTVTSAWWQWHQFHYCDVCKRAATPAWALWCQHESCDGSMMTASSAWWLQHQHEVVPLAWGLQRQHEARSASVCFTTDQIRQRNTCCPRGSLDESVGLLPSRGRAYGGGTSVIMCRRREWRPATHILITRVMAFINNILIAIWTSDLLAVSSMLAGIEKYFTLKK